LHGARSRFMTETVLQCFQRVTGPGHEETGSVPQAAAGPRIDVASRLRDMW